MKYEDRAKHFLQVADKFQLGHLPTEWPHPQTVHLSQWAQGDLKKGLDVLRDVDCQALKKVFPVLPQIADMAMTVRMVLEAGGRVFLCGCGATGRLSLTLERLWRNVYPGDERVVSLMAGGDVALVHAIEGFEDFPEYGHRHLAQLGFRENDLLISCTEGGETPYVIGASAYASETSKYPVYFLYCNPTETLKTHVERSRRILESPNICGIEIFVGPMALAGSTRMQASTVLQLAVGLALFHDSVEQMETVLRGFIQHIRHLSYEQLQDLIEREYEVYNGKDRVLYLADEFAITVFTDTTERSPTFNLKPFESTQAGLDRTSLCYVGIPSAAAKLAAWQALLGHAPRALGWPEVNSKTTIEYLETFDFSQRGIQGRLIRIQPAHQSEFVVDRDGGKLKFHLDKVQKSWPLFGQGLLFDHLQVKMLLNAHSTLLMGRLGRYQNNIMTWVTPTNNKLIDRAARYVLHLLAEQGRTDITYSQVIYELFHSLEGMFASESLVEKTYRSLCD